MISIARISATPVKNTRLAHPEAVELSRHGLPWNRRFFLVGSDGKRLRSSATAWPAVISSEYDPVTLTLTMRFPDELVVSAPAVAEGETVEFAISERREPARFVPGPWDEPLSELAGRPVVLARLESEGGGVVEPVSLVSSASVARVAKEAGVERVDARRFRMNFELDGCEEHEEDTWEGRRLRLGGALLEVAGPIIRCAVTTRDHDTGVRDLDTLRILADYRGSRENAVYFGRYARVLEPGLARVGDPVALV